MIVAKVPRRPAREWVCVYCIARGPAASEANMRELTKAHLEACHVRRKYEARIARALAMLADDGR